MKKITALFMIIALVFSLAACGNTYSDKENSATDSFIYDDSARIQSCCLRQHIF